MPGLDASDRTPALNPVYHTGMSRARTPISQAIEESLEEVSAILVEMVAFDCILDIPWLQDVNPVVGWEQKTLLFPTNHGPVEVDMSSDPCRRELPTHTEGTQYS
jgi:hypothetical protein